MNKSTREFLRREIDARRRGVVKRTDSANRGLMRDLDRMCGGSETKGVVRDIGRDNKSGAGATVLVEGA
jgi:hypothetical protein